MPEEEGVSSAELSRLVDLGEEMKLDSLLVTRHGKILLDAYYAPYKSNLKHPLNSATKGVIGILVGIAVQQGLLHDLHEPVADYFPHRTIANQEGGKAAITIQDLLDMTSGLAWTEPLDGVSETGSEMRRSPDWIQFILDRPMASPPGEVFNYNSGNPHLLSAILTKITGRTALEFANDELFKPLGIVDVRWDSDPAGNSVGGSGLYLTPQDMAKIGYFYLRNGSWDGKQIMPAGWVDRVRRASVVMNIGNGSLHYANLLWTFPAMNAFMAVGYNSQVILVLPAADVVAVFTGTRSPNLAQMTETVLAAVKSEQPLPPNAAAFTLLDQRVKEATRLKPPVVRTTVALPPEILADYVGQYPLGAKFMLTITKEADALFMQATGQRKISLLASARDEFFCKGVDAQVSFQRDGTGRVKALILHQNGQSPRAEKLP